MSQSLKYTLEEFGIAVLTGVSGLSGIDLKHVDDAEQAEQERLIFSGNIGEIDLAGPGCSVSELEIELRSTDRDEVAVDAIFAALEAALLLACQNIASGTPCAGLTFVEANFAVFVAYPERWTSSDARGPNTRHRARKYPFDILP